MARGAAAHFFAGDDVALLIAAEDGLEIQHRADQCGGCLHTAVRCRNIRSLTVKNSQRFWTSCSSTAVASAALRPSSRSSAARQASRPVPKPAPMESTGQTVRSGNSSRSSAGRDARGLISAADPGRQADIHNIQPLLQRGAEMIEEDLRVEQGGCDALALPQQFIVGVGIKGLDVAAIDDLLSVHRIAAGEHPDPKVLQQGCPADWSSCP